MRILSVSSLTAHRLAALSAALFLVFSLVAVDHAEARRGGSFGSRGSRTFNPVPVTRTAPKPVAPVERSMMPNAGPANAARQPQGASPRPGFGSGLLGGGLFRGLLLGGLFGMLLGHGFGGMAGLLGFLVQALLIGGLAWLALRFFRSQRGPAHAMAGSGPAGFQRNASGSLRPNGNAGGGFGSGLRIPGIGSGGAARNVTAASAAIKLGQADLDTFEKRLVEVQEAFGREDHAALRRAATPEMVSFLSEELADNAKKGVRNEVSDVRLLQADIAESWREDNEDYATAALLYESRDIVRDRVTGRPVDGGADALTETTELWTFKRRRGEDWKLSAIQEA